MEDAHALNRELTETLARAGERAGFQVILEYPLPGGRLDVVWAVEAPVPGVDGVLPVVGFEIESSWRTRKHVKGDLLNLQDAGVALGVIVLAGDTRPRSRAAPIRRRSGCPAWPSDPGLDGRERQSARRWSR